MALINTYKRENYWLTKDQKIDIVKKYMVDGLSTVKLGKEYNINSSAIWGILKRRGIKMRKCNATVTSRKYSLNQDFFNQIDTPEKAYFLGWLYADGCHQEKTGKIILGLQEQDVDVLKKLNQFINSNRPLFYSVRKDNSGYENRQNCYILNICSRKLSDSLIKLNCRNNKSLTLDFPNFEQVPNNLIHHFVQGFWEGDGCFSYGIRKDTGYLNQTVSFISTISFCDILNAIIEKQLGFKFISTPYIKHAALKNISTCGSQNIMKFMNWIYKDAPYKLQRKSNKYLEWKNERQKRGLPIF